MVPLLHTGVTVECACSELSKKKKKKKKKIKKKKTEFGVLCKNTLLLLNIKCIVTKFGEKNNHLEYCR